MVANTTNNHPHILFVLLIISHILLHVVIDLLMHWMQKLQHISTGFGISKVCGIINITCLWDISLSISLPVIPVCGLHFEGLVQERRRLSCTNPLICQHNNLVTQGNSGFRCIHCIEHSQISFYFDASKCSSHIETLLSCTKPWCAYFGKPMHQQHRIHLLILFIW